MKKHINGKLYDTEAAAFIGTWKDTSSKDTSLHIQESLYKKRTGEFFLLGEGGALTKYAVLKKNSIWTGSTKIIPLSFEQAESWAKEHLDTETCDHIFAFTDETASKSQMCICLNNAAAFNARKNAAKRGVSLSAYIESLIEKDEP